MFESIKNFFKRGNKKKVDKPSKSKEAAKERLHLVLMQDRANVSADFLELMKQEIIDVIKKYIEVDDNAIDVRLTHKENGDGTNGAPALYANIPIINIKNEVKKEVQETQKEENNEHEEIVENKVEEKNEKQENEEVEESEDKEEVESLIQTEEESM